MPGPSLGLGDAAVSLAIPSLPSGERQHWLHHTHRATGWEAPDRTEQAQGLIKQCQETQPGRIREGFLEEAV